MFTDALNSSPVRALGPLNGPKMPSLKVSSAATGSSASSIGSSVSTEGASVGASAGGVQEPMSIASMTITARIWKRLVRLKFIVYSPPTF